MTQVGSRVALADPAAAIRIEWARVLGVARLLDGDFSLRSKEKAMARRACGQDAIHHIYAEPGIFDDLFGCAHSHHIARLVSGKVLEGSFDDLAGALAGFADAQSSDGIAGEADFDSSFGGLFSKIQIHAALD